MVLQVVDIERIYKESDMTRPRTPDQKKATRIAREQRPHCSSSLNIRITPELRNAWMDYLEKNDINGSETLRTWIQDHLSQAKQAG